MSNSKDYNEKGPLPKGWKTKISKTTGRRYYTKSQYERPTNAMSTAPVANVVKTNIVSGGPNSIRRDPVVTAPVKVNIPQPVPVRQNKPANSSCNSLHPQLRDQCVYNSMKATIIARIKAGETIPLRPDIQNLYDLDRSRGLGGCSYPGAGKDCWTNKFQTLYDELQDEAAGRKTKAQRNNEIRDEQEYKENKDYIIRQILDNTSIPLTNNEVEFTARGKLTIEKLYGMDPSKKGVPIKCGYYNDKCKKDLYEPYYEKLKQEARDPDEIKKRKEEYDKKMEKYKQMTAPRSGMYVTAKTGSGGKRSRKGRKARKANRNTRRR
jgi:hypothetical protein